MNRLALVFVLAIFGMSFLFVSSPACAKEPSIVGTLVDVACATEPGKNLDKLRSEHTRNCLLMPICVESGYALLTGDNQVLRFDKKGNYLAGKIIEEHPQAKTWRVRVEGIPQKDQLQVKRIRLL